MKYLVALTAVVFLASCGADTTVETPATPVDTEINAEIENIEVDTEATDDESASTDSEEKIIKTTYTNPKVDVDMSIAYNLDADGKISDIEVSASNYDLADFSQALQDQVIGKTLEEASSVYVSGSSLTSEAFNAALKENM